MNDSPCRRQKPAAEGSSVDPYSVVDDSYVPEGFLVYKRRRTGSFRLHGMKERGRPPGREGCLP